MAPSGQACAAGRDSETCSCAPAAEAGASSQGADGVKLARLLVQENRFRGLAVGRQQSFQRRRTRRAPTAKSALELRAKVTSAGSGPPSDQLQDLRGFVDGRDWQIERAGQLGRTAHEGGVAGAEFALA